MYLGKRREEAQPHGSSNQAELTIIDIVVAQVWIIGVVHNQRATETVTVLRTIMGVVPKGARLIGHVEVVQERVAGSDGALVDARRPVSPVRSGLEYAMPMLRQLSVTEVQNICQGLTIEVVSNMVLFVRELTTLIWKLSPWDRV